MPLPPYPDLLLQRRADQQTIVEDSARDYMALLLALGLFAMAIWQSFFLHYIPIASALIPIPFAIWIALRIQATAQKSGQILRAVRFYEAGIARIAGEWPGTGSTGEAFAAPGHLYSHDLDLFGEGGLFELLCIARTGAGKQTLALWLENPASLEEAALRQQAIEELRSNLALREQFATAGSANLDDSGAPALLAWLIQPAIAFPPSIRFAAPLLALIFLATATLAALRLIPYETVAIALGCEAALFLSVAPQVRASQQALALPAYELSNLAPLLALLERQQFQSPFLRRCQVSGVARHASRLALLYKTLDYLRIEYLAVLFAVLLGGTQLAFAIESWRKHHGPSVRAALQSLGEFEALLCLASYAAEHPDDPFPVLLPTGTTLEAVDLGHPLLPEATCIRNSVSFTATEKFLVVSGSNMSGKSTLMRSIGLNTVLAWAGAPVRATRFSLSRLTIGASIGVTDTLTDGKSRFYAEVERLRFILDQARQGPVLFLLDEILSGTNSQDRRAGAEAILGDLLRHNAIGIVTTHDLALTAIPGARNVHFQEYFEDGVMLFDYRMKPGILDHTNGLAVMRLLGIPVES